MPNSDHQDVKDLASTRAQADVDVAVMRNFVHGTREKWEQHCKLVNVMSNDPIFHKSQR
ncbi:hypothetical protein EIP86_007676 [Pleurotus ostreatoroseus]|nr:hypothetical protein EIP86_007676 [Pleurotus ostreatoroseus]